jgi:hypothetical protein
MVPVVVPVDGVPPEVKTRRDAKGSAAIKPSAVKFPLTDKFPSTITFE